MLKKPHKLRVVLLGAGFCVLTASVVARLYHLQFLRHDELSSSARGQQTIRLDLQPERGDILDRRGEPLATSTGTLSVYINPTFFRPPEADVDLDLLARGIAANSDLSVASIRRRLAQDRVTDVGRQLLPENAQKIGDLLDDLEISRRGFWFHRESKRRYPQGLAPHVIGFTGTDGDGDNDGRSGLELAYNEEIRGSKVETRAARTGIRQVMQPVEQKDLLAARGNTLVLTIDPGIQAVAERALNEMCTELDAAGGGAVAMDVNTGAILAMASWPPFDNNDPGTFSADERRNRILTDPFETGSVVKLFTSAILLDLNLISLHTPVDCEGGTTYFGRRRIQDAPGVRLGIVPFIEAIRHSSNVGTVKAAQALENDEWYAYLRSFGLGQKTGIELPGEGAGILYPVEKWTSYSRTSLPMGYELALTPIQIVTAVSGLVNGGVLLEPYVVAEVRDSSGNVISRREPVERGRMIRPATSLLMREIMEDVVMNGNKESARVPGFRVGGKTGTTQKSQVLDRREYIASFAGVIPIDDPRVAIYTYVDDPPRGQHYGGQAAAPIFQQIASECVRQLGLIPSLLPEEEALIARSGGLGLSQMARDVVMVPSGTMPDLAGLSMAEVRETLPRDIARVRFTGSGRAADQSPAPGEVLQDGMEIRVFFSPDAPARPAPEAGTIARATGGRL